LVEILISIDSEQAVKNPERVKERSLGQRPRLQKRFR